MVPVSGHPELQPGVTGIVLRSRPDAGPARAAIGANADQIQALPALPALPALGRRVVLQQYERWPVPAGELGPDMPGGLSDGGCETGFVTTARWPGSGPAVSRTRRWATPSLPRMPEG